MKSLSYIFQSKLKLPKFCLCSHQRVAQIQKHRLSDTLTWNNFTSGTRGWILTLLSLHFLALGMGIFTVFKVQMSSYYLWTQKRDVLGCDLSTSSELRAPVPFRVWKESNNFLGLCLAKGCNSSSEIGLFKGIKQWDQTFSLMLGLKTYLPTQTIKHEKS